MALPLLCPWQRPWLRLHSEAPFCAAQLLPLPARPALPCPARSPDCCNERFGFVLEHVEQQSSCLFTEEGKPAVDFIGRSEHLEEDFKASAAELLCAPGTPLPGCEWVTPVFSWGSAG